MAPPPDFASTANEGVPSAGAALETFGQAIVLGQETRAQHEESSAQPVTSAPRGQIRSIQGRASESGDLLDLLAETIATCGESTANKRVPVARRSGSTDKVWTDGLWRSV